MKKKLNISKILIVSSQVFLLTGLVLPGSLLVKILLAIGVILGTICLALANTKDK